MKMVESYIRYEKLEAVREKLFALGIPGMSGSEVKGIGKSLSQMGSDPEPCGPATWATAKYSSSRWKKPSGCAPGKRERRL
jgi:hypothetical protein